MSAIATVFAFDGNTTPVGHLFTPLSVTREGNAVLASWRETGLNAPIIAQPRVSLKLERSKNGVYRSELKVVVPVMESILNQNAAGYTASPKVAYESTMYAVGLFNERATPTDRRIVRMLLTNMLNNIGASTAAVLTGPGPEMFDLTVMPT